MSFLEHLDELRSRLFKAVLALGAGFALSWTQSERLFRFMVEPLTPFLGGRKLVFLEITEPFMLYMKVALLAGIFAASPVILYQRSEEHTSELQSLRHLV